MEPLKEKMTDKTVLVAGGTSPEGVNIVRYFLEEGATVIVPAKSLDDMTRLKADTANINGGNLVTQLTELPDYDTGFDIAESIVERFGRIDIGIAIFNGLPCKRQLTEVGINDWQNMVDNEVTPFFVCGRMILNTMKASKGGLYISVCNSSLFEREDLSPLSKIAANAKMEMSKIFAAETKKYQVRYYHLWVKNTGGDKENIEGCKEARVISADMVGSQIMKLYQNKTDKPDEVFQLCPESTLR